MQYPQTARSPRSGFTLTEVLVVVGVLALLTSFVMPIFSSVRHQGMITTSLATVRRLDEFALAHAIDHRGAMPRSQHSRLCTPRVRPWEYVYFDYVNERAFADSDAMEVFVNDYLRCAFDSRQSEHPSWGLNVYFELAYCDTGDARVWDRYESIPRPSSTVLFGELEDASITDHIMAHDWPDNPDDVEIALDRGPSGEVYGFVDGHVVYMEFDETFSLDESGEIETDLWDPGRAR